MGMIVRRSAPAIRAGRPRPVKVRLRKINCDHARAYPPDGQAGDWWQRLKEAFGTASSEFVDASLAQLIAAARLPGSGVSEVAVNAALAFVEGAKPQDELECALALQMACTHTAAMAVLRRIGSGSGGDRNLAANASAVARLLRAYAMQVETLRRWRHVGSQSKCAGYAPLNEDAQEIARAVVLELTADPGALKAPHLGGRVCKSPEEVQGLVAEPRPRERPDAQY
jgi:hypothetical protein